MGFLYNYGYQMQWAACSRQRYDCCTVSASVVEQHSDPETEAMPMVMEPLCLTDEINITSVFMTSSAINGFCSWGSAPSAARTLLNFCSLGCNR
jgi:hypothetical protein